MYRCSKGSDTSSGRDLRRRFLIGGGFRAGVEDGLQPSVVVSHNATRAASRASPHRRRASSPRDAAGSHPGSTRTHTAGASHAPIDRHETNRTAVISEKDGARAPRPSLRRRQGGPHARRAILRVHRAYVRGDPRHGREDAVHPQDLRGPQEARAVRLHPVHLRGRRWHRHHREGGPHPRRGGIRRHRARRALLRSPRRRSHHPGRCTNRRSAAHPPHSSTHHPSIIKSHPIQTVPTPNRRSICHQFFLLVIIIVADLWIESIPIPHNHRRPRRARSRRAPPSATSSTSSRASRPTSPPPSCSSPTSTRFTNAGSSHS